MDDPLIEELGDLLAKGYTKRQAAALTGINEVTFSIWLKRAREDLERGEQTLRVDLYNVVERAEAEYLTKQLDLLHRSAVSRAVDYRPIKWLLSVRAPKEFTQSSPEAQANTTEGTPFELVTPEEAEAFVEEKLARFLEAEPPPKAEPQPQPAPEAPNGG